MTSTPTAERAVTSDESWFASNRKPMLLILAGVVAISGYQFFSGLYSKQKEEKAWAALLEADKPGAEKDRTAVEASVKGTSAEAWFFLSEVSKALEKEDFEKAKSWLRKLSALSEPELRRIGSPITEGATLSANVQAKIKAFEEWKSKNSRFFQNPDPAQKPRIRFVTDAGEFAVGLYPQEAPKTTENFLKLCREGFYNETRLSEVFTGYSIRGGDPSTRAEPPTAWTNQGPGYELDLEKNSLFNFQWAVSMYRVPGQEKVSGSQFVIALQNQLAQDAPVFGVVMEGRELLKAIGDAGSEFKDGKSVPKKLVTIKEVRIEE